jgi:hypothetical protein
LEPPFLEILSSEFVLSIPQYSIVIGAGRYSPGFVRVGWPVRSEAVAANRGVAKRETLKF